MMTQCLYENIRTSYDGSNIVKHTGRLSDGSVCGIILTIEEEEGPYNPPNPPSESCYAQYQTVSSITSWLQTTTGQFRFPNWAATENTTIFEYVVTDPNPSAFDHYVKFSSGNDHIIVKINDRFLVDGVYTKSEIKIFISSTRTLSSGAEYVEEQLFYYDQNSTPTELAHFILTPEDYTMSYDGSWFCVKEIPLPPAPSTILLTGVTNGGNTTMVQNQIITFKDSGANSNYGNNQRYAYTFTIPTTKRLELTFNDFRFEHATYAMYDRLGLIVDGQNVSIPWMQSSATITQPWSASFGGTYWDSSQSKPGWLLPMDFARAISLGWVQTTPTILSNLTTLTFLFFSDSSVPDRGWNINIKCI